MASETESRKFDHVNICLRMPVEFRKGNGFERVELKGTKGKISKDRIDMSREFLGFPFRYPLFIEAMTGGFPEAEKINRNLARAAEDLGIGMGVGSQRAMIEDPGLTHTYQVRDVAPNIFLLGNIGAMQFSEFPIGQIRKAIEDIGANGLAVHINPAQEAVQPEGRFDWKAVFSDMESLCKSLGYPVVAKEVGCGISGETAERLEKSGVKAIDVAGAGGTSWVRVEGYRAKTEEKRSLAEKYNEWGIPTMESLKQCLFSTNLPVIASGGMRTGKDCAKALAMGAKLVGFALPLLKPATKGSESVKKFLEKIIDEMKSEMSRLGARDLEELGRVEIIGKNI